MATRPNLLIAGGRATAVALAEAPGRTDGAIDAEQYISTAGAWTIIGGSDSLVRPLLGAVAAL